MKKIPTIFKRDTSNMSLVTEEVNPACMWVFRGEGVPTIKLDGTACMIDAKDRLWKRYTLRPGKERPEVFVACETDANTGKTFGWVPVSEDDRWHLEAFAILDHPERGTYELVGPKVQGNPEKLDRHELIAHSSPELVLADIPRDFAGLRSFLETADIEGVVWHHLDGRMAKIKTRDFGIERKP